MIYCHVYKWTYYTSRRTLYFYGVCAPAHPYHTLMGWILHFIGMMPSVNIKAFVKRLLTSKPMNFSQRIYHQDRERSVERTHSNWSMCVSLGFTVRQYFQLRDKVNPNRKLHNICNIITYSQHPIGISGALLIGFKPLEFC
jgi:hypothetical protein